MKTYTHHVLVVSAPTFRDAQTACSVAGRIFPWVSPPGPGLTGGWHTFVVPPDGAPEGTPRSEEGDENRARFRAYLKRNPAIHWIEVAYGPDGARLVDDSSRYLDPPGPAPERRPSPLVAALLATAAAGPAAAGEGRPLALGPLRRRRRLRPRACRKGAVPRCA